MKALISVRDNRGIYSPVNLVKFVKSMEDAQKIGGNIVRRTLPGHWFKFTWAEQTVYTRIIKEADDERSHRQIAEATAHAMYLRQYGDSAGFILPVVTEAHPLMVETLEVTEENTGLVDRVMKAYTEGEDVLVDGEGTHVAYGDQSFGIEFPEGDVEVATTAVEAVEILTYGEDDEVEEEDLDDEAYNLLDMGDTGDLPEDC